MNLKNIAALTIIASLLITGCAGTPVPDRLPGLPQDADVIQAHLDDIAAHDGVEILYGEHMTTIRLREEEGAPSIKEIVSFKENNPEAYATLEMHIILENAYTEVILLPASGASNPSPESPGQPQP